MAGAEDFPQSYEINSLDRQPYTRGSVGAIGLSAAMANQRDSSGSPACDKWLVRESVNNLLEVQRPYSSTQALAHPSLSLQLNTSWRVTEDLLQWVLQSKKGRPRSKNSGWRSRFFFRTREGLVAHVREYCGKIEPDARKALSAFPEWHA